MNRKMKGWLLFHVSVICSVGLLGTIEGMAADIHPVMQSAYQIETRAINFYVEQKTVVELDGRILSNPKAKGRKTDVYYVPNVTLGRHHVKLMNPLAEPWEGTIMVTSTFPDPQSNQFSLVGKLDFTQANTAEKRTTMPRETKVPPQIGYVLLENVWWRLKPNENEIPQEQFRKNSGFDVIGVLNVDGELWYHIDMGYEKCGWVEAKYVYLKWGTLKYSEEEAHLYRNGK